MTIYPLPDDLFDEILDFLASGRTIEENLAFQSSETLKERSHYLLEKDRKDLLSAEERQELENFRRMNHFVNMLKIRARQKLAKGA